MHNRKNSQKLSIPAEFNLAAYRTLRHWSDPRMWLEQFALRIDIALLLKTVKQNHGNGPGLLVDEFYVNEMMTSLWANPLEPVNDFTEYFVKAGVSFPTLDLVEIGPKPVALMTVADLYTAECSIHPMTRSWGRKFSERLEREVPYPEEEYLGAIVSEDETLDQHGGDFSSKALLANHWQRLNAQAKSFRTEDPKHGLTPGLFDFPIQESLSGTEGRDMPLYLMVNTSAPYKVAEAAFRKYYEAQKSQSSYYKQIDDTLLARWCDDGILPYIDLKLYEQIRAMQEADERLAIPERSLADAIYASSPPRSESCVSDTTKPMAKQLSDPGSALFLSMLATFGGPR